MVLVPVIIYVTVQIRTMSSANHLLHLVIVAFGIQLQPSGSLRNDKRVAL
jgi:hypothetical protein